MKRIVSWSLSLVVALVMFIGAIPAFAAAGNYAPLPADPVNVTLLYPGPSSYFQATISGTAVPSINGVYQAWCIDLHNSHLANYDALALNSYGTIPADDAALIDVLGLPKVNWVLNQNFVGNPSPPGGSGIVTWPDVQAAIWILLSQAYAPGVEEYPSDAARRTAIVNAANTFGGSFDPVFGQVSAVILDPIPVNRQLVVITLPVPNSNGGQNNDPAAVGDFVWNDVNHNGIQDAVEAGVAGVTVNLFDNLNTLVATTTTDVNGKYGFSVTAGQYYVQVALPAGYNFTLQDQGADNAVDSDVNASTGNTALFTISAGQFAVTWDAGLACDKDKGDKDHGDKGDKDKGDKDHGDKGDKDKGDKGDKDKGDKDHGDKGDKDRGDKDHGDKGDKDKGDKDHGDKGDKDKGDKDKGDNDHGDNRD